MSRKNTFPPYLEEFFSDIQPLCCGQVSSLRRVAHPCGGEYIKPWVPHSFAFCAKGWARLAASTRPAADHGRGGRRNHLEFRRLAFIEQDWSGFAAGVVAIAAPEPLLRFEDQSALHRVAVHVAQILHALPLGPNVEIVEAFLPDVSVFERAAPEPELARMAGDADLVEDAGGDALLENLHHGGERAAIGFAEQQVDVFGHDDVAVNDETVTLASFFEDGEEEITIAGVAEKRAALVATAGNEVEVVVAVVAFQAGGHRGRIELGGYEGL
jgi:hypothetical protein